MKALPVVEQDGLIWVWPGDAAKATAGPPATGRRPEGFQVGQAGPAAPETSCQGRELVSDQLGRALKPLAVQQAKPARAGRKGNSLEPRGAQPEGLR